MFKLAQAATFAAPVSIHLYAESGELVEHQFTARFNYLKQPDFIELIQGLGGEGSTDLRTLERVWCGWGPDLADEYGAPLVYSAEAREKVLQVQGMAAALIRAFFNAMGSAQAKNSEPALAGSTASAKSA